MNYLLSIDLGLRACGCAAWIDGQLLRAEHVRAQERMHAESAIVGEMRDCVSHWLVSTGMPLTNVVIELPQTYKGRASKGDANNLILLGALAGALMSRNYETEFVSPHGWKGTIPKENDQGVNVVRERCQAALTSVERGRVSLPRAKGEQHNVWDPIGIGLWRLGRAFRD